MNDQPAASTRAPIGSAHASRGQRGRPAIGSVKRRSIAAYLAMFLALQVFILSALIAFGASHDFRSARAEAAARATTNARHAADLIGQGVAEGKTTLAYEASLPGYDAVFSNPSDCSVTSSESGVFAKGDFHIIRANGSVACTSRRPSGGLAGPGYAGSAWLKGLASAEGAVVAGPLRDPVSQRRALLIAAPIAKTKGALVLSLDLDALGSGLDGRFRIGKGSPGFFVVSPDRSTEVTRSNGPAQTPRLNGTPFADALSESGTTLNGLDGVRRIYAEAQVPGLGWHVYAGIGEQDVLADVKRSLRDRIGLGGASLLVVLLVGLAIHRRVTGPVKRLALAVAAAAEGDLSAHVPADGPRELANLGERFNAMLDARSEVELALVEAYETERRATDRLRELSALKSSFLRAISHAIRTPLTMVTGFSRLLAEPDATRSPAETLDVARRLAAQARRLERLLLDAIDLERLTRGAVEPKFQPTDVRALVAATLRRSGGKGKVTVDVSNGTRAIVDPGLVERIIDNLVVNARKHTPRGTPISVSVRQDDDELLLIVDDAGPGVPDKLKKVIFEPFRHGDLAEHSPGTGVGLALVAHFAALHGGRAWVEDRPGGGASFRVSLAAARAKRRAAAA